MDVYEIRLLTDELFDMDTMLFVSIEVLEQQMKAYEDAAQHDAVAVLDRTIRQARKLRILMDDAYRAQRPRLYREVA